VDYAQQQRNPGKHAVGIGVVVAMHVLLAWALISGLAQRVVEVVRQPIETKIIEDVKPPPPPPPPALPPPPKYAPPPPSYVPPPEVVVAPPPTPAPSITTVTTPPPPAPVTIAPAPSPAPPAPPAPAARTEPRLDFNVCEKPVYSAAARRAEAQGEVTVEYTMDTNGRIGDAKVVRSSGPTREHKQLDRLTVEAVLACKGTPGTVDGKPQTLTSRVTYVWKIE
jgi:protein TonB